VSRWPGAFEPPELVAEVVRELDAARTAYA